MVRRSSRHVKNGVGDIAADLPILVTPKTDVPADKTNTAEEDESDMEDEGWDDDDDEADKNSEDEDSDYDAKRQNTTKTPAKKKAKTGHSKKVSRRKNLGLLLTMPLDVLFEIISQLSPKDIINLSRTSKTFHETLSSRSSIAVWKAARERVAIPEGPDWMSEAAWADLVFAHTCESCATRGVHNVDFHLLKRICLSCKKTHYVLRAKVEKRYPDADFVILDLVPSTNISAWSSWARSSYYYWDKDLEFMISKLATMKEDGASAKEVTSFMEERKRRVQYIRVHSSSWQTWHERMKSDRTQEAKDAENRRLHQVQDRFRALGYIDQDLDRLEYQNECRGKAQLTDKIWSRIRPILEPGVKVRKAERLERELASTKHTRQQILSARYKNFQRTLNPLQWRYLPRSWEILRFEPFARHIEADIGVEVDEKTFDEAFLELPNLLATATEQHKATLRALMGGTPRQDGENGLDPLDLATATFKCAEAHSSRCEFGWDEIASHHCKADGNSYNWYLYSSASNSAPVEFKYNPRIAHIVGNLARLIGLNATSATAADFDRKNLRFGCDSCIGFKQNGQYYRLGYGWRDLAVHLETSSHNPDLRIMILPEKSANELKECERNDRKWSTNLWTCSHCPEFLDKLQSKEIVKKHLSDLHGIETPSEPTDYFFFERYRKEWCPAPKFSIPEPEKRTAALKFPILHRDVVGVTGKFRCLVCLTHTNRLFVPTGIVDHLRAKHNISDGKNGVHYASS